MKDIKGFEGIYAVTENGQVFSYRKGNYLSLNYKKNGYVYVELNVNGNVTNHRVHRLVAETFIANSDNKPFVNHKNGIKSDNRVCNLEWATGTENNLHAIKEKLVDLFDRWDVYQHDTFVGTFVGYKEIIARFGIAKNTVGNAIKLNRPTRSGLRIERSTTIS